MDEIFKLNDSESENEYSSEEEEESKLALTRNKKNNKSSDSEDSDSENEEETETPTEKNTKNEEEKEKESIKIENEKSQKKESINNNNDKGKNKNKNKKSNIDSRFDMSQFNEDDLKVNNDQNETNENDTTTTPEDKKSTKKVKKPLSEANLKKFKQKHDKTGVVYLSRIPPFMRPIKLRHLLSRYAEIGRIYLAAEDEKIAMRRKKYGGNRKVNYTEGWVEFMDKRQAKLVVNHLNNQIIGGKKSNWYHDDIWNMKYLHGFKWIHLTERIAYEKAVRNQKLKTEMAQTARESLAVMKNVEKARMIESMEKRNHEKRERSGEEGEEGESVQQKKTKTEKSENTTNSLKEDQLKILRKYKQRKPVVVENDTAGTEKKNVKTKKVLSKIFG